MSQYLFFIGEVPKEIDIEAILILPSTEFDQEGPDSLSKDSSVLHFHVVDQNSFSSHELFNESMESIRDGKKFLETRLGMVVKTLVEHQNKIIMWYNIDYFDLPTIYKAGPFLKELENQLMDFPGEVYLEYSPVGKSI